MMTIASRTTLTTNARARNARVKSRTTSDRVRVVVVNAANGKNESERALKDGELDIKRGLLGVFVKDGEEEVSKEKFRAFQDEIKAKKAAAAKKAAEARANKKGPFGLW